MAYNPLHKLQDNIAAIRIALDHVPGNLLAADAIAALMKYAGFGGIKAILYETGTIEEWIGSGASKEDLKLYDQVQELHALLNP
jgi:hypothetical protein